MAKEFIISIIDYVNNIFSGFYTKILASVVVLLIGIILGKIAGKLLKRILHEVELDVILKKASGIDMGLEKILSGFTTYFIYFIAIIMALNQLNITTTVLQMISGAVIIIIIISIVLAIKDFIPNMFAGIYIYRNRFIKEGETIKVKGIEGKIVKINLVETKIETKGKDVVYIPNSALTKTEIIKKH